MTRRVKCVKDFLIDLNYVLGTGGFGIVYLGKYKDTPEKVAVKVIDTNTLVSEYSKMALQNQISILNELDSENVIKCIRVMESKSNIYIVQEYAEGKLNDVPKQKVRNYISQIANGFKAIIRRGIVHRDLKPDNILLKGDVIKIADFGLSKISEGSRKDFSTAVGTIPYMAPEVLSRESKYSYKCDIWSFGVVCYELETGIKPWPDDKSLFVNLTTFVEALKKICSQGIQFPESFDPKLKDLVIRCLTFDQGERATWKQIYEHDYFEGRFTSETNHEFLTHPDEQFAITKIRKSVVENNTNLELLFSLMPSEITQKNLFQILQTLEDSMTLSESNSIFNCMSFGEKAISSQMLMKYLENNGVNLNAVNVMAEKFKDPEIVELAKRILSYFLSKNTTPYELFTSHQLSSSNYIDLQGFQSIMKSLEESLTDAQLQKVFNLFDLNKNKKIGVNHAHILLSKLLQIPPMFSKEASNAFKKLKQKKQSESTNE